MLSGCRGAGAGSDHGRAGGLAGADHHKQAVDRLLAFVGILFGHVDIPGHGGNDHVSLGGLLPDYGTDRLDDLGERTTRVGGTPVELHVTNVVLEDRVERLSQ